MWWRRLRYLLLVLALSTLATCPIGVRSCRSKERSVEASQLLKYLAQRAEVVWKATGSLPPQSIGPTPSPGACCDNGGSCAVDISRWDEPGWIALGFTIDGPHRFAYTYEVAGNTATVRATGDLDCDGVYSIFEGKLEPEGDHLRVTWTSTNPTE